jgi:formylglycine-generating enzyme required for sulfatase activity
MGVVYLAHNKLMGRDEVLKVMDRQIVDRPDVLERFLREIRAVARLRHPNIVTAYSATRLGESIVFAMEFVDGLDLARLVDAQGPMPAAQACYFAYQAALGLQHAHEEGLVHRDIKPGNLMVARKGDKATVKILDFGLAKATREEQVEGGLTSAGQALGTPDYMAPEQIVDAPSADIRADIYSLGATLYYLLTGRPPFQAKSLYHIYQAHIARTAEPLNALRPDVPAELAAVVAKMMAKEPAKRFQTPDEVARALAPFSKNVNASLKIPRADVARAGAGPSPTASEGGYAATRLETEADRLRLRARPGKTAGPSGDESGWESAIDFGVTESATAEAEAVPRRRSKWLWPGVVAGVLLLGLVAVLSAWVFRDKTLPKEITNTIGMKLVLIPAGEFLMGSPDSDKEAMADEKPRHRVRITRPFYLSATEVTQGQYRAATGANPSNFNISDDMPVEQVSWEEARAFCDKLNALEKQQLGGARYRLPTEAEWEYACRAGTTTRYSFGDWNTNLEDYAWFGGNSDRRSHPVGQKRPNAWGLFDMNGSVWEWCGDWYGYNYYGRSPVDDPPGPSGSTVHVNRGGSWSSNFQVCRAAFRGTGSPGLRSNNIGFRVARVASSE